MKIEVTVKPGAKRDSIEKQPNGSFKLTVKAPPTQGKANAEVIRLLAKHFGVPKSHVSISKGGTGRKKWVEILSR